MSVVRRPRAGRRGRWRGPSCQCGRATRCRRGSRKTVLWPNGDRWCVRRDRAAQVPEAVVSLVLDGSLDGLLLGDSVVTGTLRHEARDHAMDDRSRVVALADVTEILPRRKALSRPRRGVKAAVSGRVDSQLQHLRHSAHSATLLGHLIAMALLHRPQERTSTAVPSGQPRTRRRISLGSTRCWMASAVQAALSYFVPQPAQIRTSNNLSFTRLPRFLGRTAPPRASPLDRTYPLLLRADRPHRFFVQSATSAPARAARFRACDCVGNGCSTRERARTSVIAGDDARNGKSAQKNGVAGVALRRAVARLPVKERGADLAR